MWDEAHLAHRSMLEALDRTLRDLMQEDLPFGGNIILLGGDFHQALPVVKCVSWAQITDALIKCSAVLQHFHIYEL